MRQLALLGGGSLAAAIHSQPIPSNASVNTAPPAEVLPPPTGDLTNMLIYSFHTLFTELELQVLYIYYLCNVNPKYLNICCLIFIFLFRIIVIILNACCNFGLH